MLTTSPWNRDQRFASRHATPLSEGHLFCVKPLQFSLLYVARSGRWHACHFFLNMSKISKMFDGSSELLPLLSADVNQTENTRSWTTSKIVCREPEANRSWGTFGKIFGRVAGLQGSLCSVFIPNWFRVQLVPFRFRSSSILVPFGLPSGSLLVPFRFPSGSLPVLFCYVSIPVRFRFRFRFGSVPVPFRFPCGSLLVCFRFRFCSVALPFRFGSVPVPFNRSGSFFAVLSFRSGSVPVLVLFRFRSGSIPLPLRSVLWFRLTVQVSVLVRFRSGPIPVQFRFRSGWAVPVLFWFCSASIPVWFRFLSVLFQFRSCSVAAPFAFQCCCQKKWKNSQIEAKRGVLR